MAVLREDVFVVEPVRTPIGKFGGALASLSAVEIGTFAARATVARAGIAPEAVDELIFGNARQAGVGPNPARQIAFRSGFGERVPAYTVNQACGSGMRAIINAADAIRLGNAALLIAGGTESMSNTPYMLPRARWGLRMGDGEIIDGMLRDGFICPLAEEMMGATAETLAERYAIDRNEQDAYVVETQRRAAQAWSDGNFANEVIAVTVQGKKGDVVVDRDEHLRGDTTMESLAKLPPVFRPGGTVHAGNSSGITDGAAAMIVAGADAVKRHGLRPIARIVAYQQAAIDPKVMGLGPVPATRRLLEETGLTMDRIDLVELNEAFAAQLLACDRELAFDRARLNVNGGAIALGHPIGCSGARIVTTLVHALAARKKSIGLATLCISGGMGMSMLFERC